jgi:hypothetical protein
MPSPPPCLKSSIEYRAMSVGMGRTLIAPNGKSHQFAERAGMADGLGSAHERRFIDSDWAVGLNLWRGWILPQAMSPPQKPRPGAQPRSGFSFDSRWALGLNRPHQKHDPNSAPVLLWPGLFIWPSVRKLTVRQRIFELIMSFLQHSPASQALCAAIHLRENQIPFVADHRKVNKWNRF